MKKKIECFTLKLDYQKETLSKRKKKSSINLFLT